MRLRQEPINAAADDAATAARFLWGGKRRESRKSCGMEPVSNPAGRTGSNANRIANTVPENMLSLGTLMLGRKSYFSVCPPLSLMLPLKKVETLLLDVANRRHIQRSFRGLTEVPAQFTLGS